MSKFAIICGVLGALVFLNVLARSARTAAALFRHYRKTLESARRLREYELKEVAPDE